MITKTGFLLPAFSEDDFLTKNYSFDLPNELIADRAVLDRHSSKLLIYDEQYDQIIHDSFYNLDKYIPHDSTIVFNQSKVFPSRIVASKLTGGKAEIFLLTPKPNENGLFKTLVKYRGKKQIGDQLHLFYSNDEKQLEIAGIATIVQRSLEDDSVFLVRFENDLDPLILAELPIPPYIRNGKADDLDKKQYQTTYGNALGSVAAPTAGLHFSEELREKLKNQGIDEAFVTLHVGLGTFRPVLSDDIKSHLMHSEQFNIDSLNFEKIQKAKYRLAVGTTSLRTLESVARMDQFKTDLFYSTNIFLHPGILAQSIDALITNFHLPESTLIMLVSALIGRKKTLEIYKEAIEKKYRFFSYGDGMLIKRKKNI